MTRKSSASVWQRVPRSLDLWSCILCNKGPFKLSKALQHEDDHSHQLLERSLLTQSTLESLEEFEPSDDRTHHTEIPELEYPSTPAGRGITSRNESIPALPSVPRAGSSTPETETRPAYISPGPRLPSDPLYFIYDDFDDDEDVNCWNNSNLEREEESTPDRAYDLFGATSPFSPQAFRQDATLKPITASQDHPELEGIQNPAWDDASFQPWLTQEVQDEQI